MLGMSEVKSLTRGLHVLDELMRRYREKGRALTVTTLAEMLDINKSSASRILKTLADNGYAQREDGSRAYVLGDKLRFDHSGLQHNLAVVAQPFLEYLVEMTNESAHIAVHVAGRVLFLKDVEAKASLRAGNSEGRTEALHCTAVGKTLLAFQSLALPTVLSKRTDKTLTTPSALHAHLETIRQQGYALDDEENFLGVRCLAAPVYNHQGTCIACMGVSGPTLRMTDEAMASLARHVKELAAALSQHLGYNA